MADVVDVVVVDCFRCYVVNVEKSGNVKKVGDVEERRCVMEKSYILGGVNISAVVVWIDC